MTSTKGPADPELAGQPPAGSEVARRQQGRGDVFGFLCRGRCFLVAFFTAVVIWQLVILPQHFDFAAMRERDKPEHHLLQKWKEKQMQEEIQRLKNLMAKKGIQDEQNDMETEDSDNPKAIENSLKIAISKVQDLLDTKQSVQALIPNYSEQLLEANNKVKQIQEHLINSKQIEVRTNAEQGRHNADQAEITKLRNNINDLKKQIPQAGAATGCYDMKVLITGHRGENLHDNHGKIEVHHNIGSWEQWTVSDAGDGKVFIKGHRNTDLQDNNGTVTASKNKGSWEKWTLIDAGNGKVLIKSHRNENLRDNNGHVETHKNTGSWEQWVITLPNGQPCQGFLAKESSQIRPQDEIHKPYYDIVTLIFSTGSDKDKQRMHMAEKTWLTWHGNYTTNLTMTYVFVFCQGDPGTSDCPAANSIGGSTGACLSIHEHAVMLPCPSDYARLIGKGVAGYRYVAEHYDFRYVIKADVDSVMDVKCAVNQISNIPKSCTSWGLGLWRVVGDSKVMVNEPGAGKYKNPAYKKDTGNDYYPPYMTGWAMVWSGDVARFLGMAGLSTGGLHSMPKWRETWTIEDAAIGTFIAGVNLCRRSIKGLCPIWTDMTTPKDFHKRDLILNQGSEDELAKTIEIAENFQPQHKHGSRLEDFEGPHQDAIVSGPRGGDLGNLHAKDLRHCAANCYLHADCRAFEFLSKTHKNNCQLQSKKWPRTGKPIKDVGLWIRMDV